MPRTSSGLETILGSRIPKAIVRVGEDERKEEEEEGNRSTHTRGDQGTAITNKRGVRGVRSGAQSLVATSQPSVRRLERENAARRRRVGTARAAKRGGSRAYDQRRKRSHGALWRLIKRSAAEDEGERKGEASLVRDESFPLPTHSQRAGRAVPARHALRGVSLSVLAEPYHRPLLRPCPALFINFGAPCW